MSLFDKDFAAMFEDDETVTVAKPDATLSGSDVTDDVENKENTAADQTAASNTATEGGSAKNPKGKKKAAKKPAKRRHSVKEDDDELSPEELGAVDGEQPDTAIDKVENPSGDETEEVEPDESSEEDDECENPEECEDGECDDEGGVDGSVAEEIPVQPADQQPAAEDDDAENPAPALPAEPAPDDAIANAPEEMPAADVAAAVTPAEKAEDTAAATNDADAEKLTDVQGAPAIDECKEQANFFCMEAVKVNIAFDHVDKACTEAWVTSSTDYQKAVIESNFKESAKKYWEKFKGFCVRMINLIKRTAIRVMTYIKKMAMKLAYKVVTNKVIMDAAKNSKKFSKRLEGKDIMTFPDIFLDNASQLLAEAAVDKSNNGPKKSLFVNPADEKVLIDIVFKNNWTLNNDYDKKQVQDIKLKETSEYRDAIIKPEIKKTVTLPIIEKFAKELEDNDIKKVLDAVSVQANSIRSFIEKAEKQASTVKDFDTEIMVTKIAAINKLVSVYNRKLSLINSLAIMWIRIRVSAIMKFASLAGVGRNVKDKALGRKGEAEDANKDDRDAQADMSSYRGTDLLSQYMSMI